MGAGRDRTRRLQGRRSNRREQARPDVAPARVASWVAYELQPTVPIEQEVRLHARADGVEPFTRWVEGLRDPSTRDRIQERISRLRAGGFGDFRSVGGGVFELRLPFGAGMRVYFGRVGDSIVLLLCGGD